MYTLDELRLLIEAVDTLIMEYGERPERTALLRKLTADRDRLASEIERARL